MFSPVKVRLFRRVFRHRGLLLAALGLTLLFSLVSGVSLGIILPFVDLLFQGKSAIVAPPAGAGMLDQLRYGLEVRAADWFFAGDPREALARVCLALVAAFALKGLLGFLVEVTTVLLEERVLKDLRDDLFEHLQSLSMIWFSGRRSGELLSRATNDVQVVRKAVSSMYRSLPRDLLLAMVYLGIVFVASWRLALVCFVVAPVFGVTIRLIGKRIRRQSGRAQAHHGDLTSVFQEAIGGIRVVKAFGGERFKIEKFRRSTEQYLRSIVRMRRTSATAAPVAELLGAVGAAVVLWVGGNEVLSGAGLTAPWFVIFLAALVSLMQPLRSISQINTHLEEGDAAAARIFEVLDTVPGVPAPANPVAIAPLANSLRFENVSFHYDEESPVLHEMEFEVGRGEIVALVGASGAGKSTLVDLIPRFHDPVSGRVTWDGIDLRNASLKDLRGHLGIVTQETILFHDTIAANIAFADPAPDEARMIAAAKAANAHEFIAATPEGYGTRIGDRGVRLSGGERQRIAIARAIYREPTLLILDEATSSLDSESEAKVQDAIDRLMKGRTAVVIAHRLSTVRHADKIVVLERGRIVEEGRHDELLAAGGRYATFCRRQFGETASAGRT
ncbi:MAG: ABC transporter ATP-binding protein [Gemmatimonadetes bacterium]|nr:ABC transporter ATP-binding protein [Gemmatimonadota bacterium]